jgi:hypothetical protein
VRRVTPDRVLSLIGTDVGIRCGGVRSELASRIMYGLTEDERFASETTVSFDGIVSYMRGVFEVLDTAAEDEPRLDPAERSDLGNDLGLLLAWGFNLDEMERKKRFFHVADASLSQVAADLQLDEGHVSAMKQDVLVLVSRWGQTIAASTRRAPTAFA